MSSTVRETVSTSPDEIAEALSILGMSPEDVRCAYCGDKKTEWDHLRPLVVKQRPTGFVSEIANLVPSCGKCNQSKGNKDWHIWIMSETAKHSPTARKIAETAKRIQRLEAYEIWRRPIHVDFRTILGGDEWDGYWKLWDDVNAELRRCQDVAELLRKRIAEAVKAKRDANR